MKQNQCRIQCASLSYMVYCTNLYQVFASIKPEVTSMGTNQVVISQQERAFFLEYLCLNQGFIKESIFKGEKKKKKWRLVLRLTSRNLCQSLEKTFATWNSKQWENWGLEQQVPYYASIDLFHSPESPQNSLLNMTSQLAYSFSQHMNAFELQLYRGEKELRRRLPICDLYSRRSEY